jgi:glycosyl transferase family 25
MNNSIRDLFAIFPQKTVINLPERMDRRRETYREFARLGVDLDQLEFEFFPAFRFSDPNGFPNAGARGCFASHLACLKQAVDRGHSRVLILEDDITFSTALLASTPYLRDRLQQDNWSFAYFAHEMTGVARARPNDTSQMRRWDGSILTTAMYAVQGQDILVSLVDFLERIADPAKAVGTLGPMTIDGAYNEFRKLNPAMVTLVATPLPVWQRPSASSISPTALESRMPSVMPILNLLRRIRHSIMRQR